MISQLFRPSLLMFSIFVLGIILRIKQYLVDRSLWLDELFFAVNFLPGKLTDLITLPLDYSHSHVAPPGFMLSTYVMVTLLGTNEYTLRLLPFACGIASLFLFARLAKLTLSSSAYPIALLLFAVSDALIYYSAEFKQYSCDVCINLILFLWAVKLFKQRLTTGKLFEIATVGCIILWFSHPAAFFIGALGLYFGGRELWHKNWKNLVALGLIGSAWLISFILMYRFVGGNVQESDIGAWLIKFWEIHDSFMPSLLSLEGWNWLVVHYLKLFAYPGDINAVTIAAWLSVGGAIVLILTNRGRYAFLLLTPIMLAAMASYFKKFPFNDRLLLFTLPAVYMLIAEAIANLHFTKHKFSTVLTVGLSFILLAYLVNFPVYRLQYRQEIKPILSHVQSKFQAEDKLYLYYWAEPAFRFYANQYGFDSHACGLLNPIPINKYTKEVDFYRKQQHLTPVPLSSLKCVLGLSETFQQSLADLVLLQDQGRIWFVFSHAFPGEGERFIEYLDGVGQRLDEITQPGSQAFLYKL